MSSIVDVKFSKYNLIQSKVIGNKGTCLRLFRRKCFIAALSTLVLLSIVVMRVFIASKRIDDTRYSGMRYIEQDDHLPTPLDELTNPLVVESNFYHLFDVVVHNTTSIKEYSNYDALLLTSPRTSIFYPVRQTYEVGDTVEVRIDAYDGAGRPQSVGGDFWFVIAMSPDKQFRSTARLVDYRNGSYSAFFLAPFAGRLELHVTLAYTSDAVRWLSEVYMKADGCFIWSARYDKFGRSSQGKCVVKRGLNNLQNKNICFYGANETGMGESAFICTIPDGFNCEDIKAINSYQQFKGIDQPVNQLLAGKKYLFNGTFYKSQLTSPQSVNQVDIVHKKSIMSGIYDYVVERPRVNCGDGDSRNTSVLPEGYWLGTRWQSLICYNSQWDDHGNVKKCLKDHRIIMFGDSIACQWFRVLQRKLDNRNVPDSYYYCNEDETHTVLYKRHVLSAALTAVFNFFGIERMFEPEYMDSLNDPNVKYVILVSMSAHYASWNMDSYRDRMREIRNAFVRMRTRLGNDHVIPVIKKSQPREQPSFQARVHSNDYVFRQMGRIMDEEFVGIDAKFIDTWDLVLSYQKDPVVHMPWPCINEEVDLFLSYICPS